MKLIAIAAILGATSALSENNFSELEFQLEQLSRKYYSKMCCKAMTPSCLRCMNERIIKFGKKTQEEDELEELRKIWVPETKPMLPELPPRKCCKAMTPSCLRCAGWSEERISKQFGKFII